MTTISTHVLDTVLGKPAADISVRLEKQEGGGWIELSGGSETAERVQDAPCGWIEISAGVTDADGRCQLAGKALSDDELKVALQQAKARGPGKTVLLQVAQGVTHGRVLEVADFARAAGLPISMGADGK